MRTRALQLLLVGASLGVAACGGADNRRGEPGAQGTAGTAQDSGSTSTSGKQDSGAASKSARTVLTGCLEKNLRSGQFELVLEGQGARRAGDANAGLQPGHDRLELLKQGDVELNQYVGKRVTLEGALGAGQPVSDAGTRSYAAGKGADSSQTRSREGDSRKMTVNSVKDVGDTCPAEKR
jgi:hypothetical protein